MLSFLGGIVQFAFGLVVGRFVFGRPVNVSVDMIDEPESLLSDVHILPSNIGCWSQLRARRPEYRMLSQNSPCGTSSDAHRNV